MERSFIVCSAIRAKDGVIYTGERHNDCIRAATQLGYFGNGQVSDEDQGFVDEDGNFHNRKQGAARAIQKRQVEKLKWPSHGLFSEDLY